MTNPIDDQAAFNLKLSQLALHNEEIAENAAKSISITNELADELVSANKELIFWNGEIGKRTVELTILNAEKAKSVAELVIANAEKAERVAELAIAKRDTLYDGLTKLPNRRLFIDRFNQAILTSGRSKTYAAILFLDLDKFKLVNDHYGHAVGDILLLEVAKRVKKSLRDVDTVARFGGDEFAVLISNLDVDKKRAITEVEMISEKIRSSIAMPVIAKRDHEELVINPQCTVSIGAALFLYTLGEPKAVLENILDLADKAMYQAKQAGGNQVQID